VVLSLNLFGKGETWVCFIPAIVGAVSDQTD
jgi:hypothetical protein